MRQRWTVSGRSPFRVRRRPRGSSERGRGHLGQGLGTAHRRGWDAEREVGRSAAGQPAELPVPGHPRRLPLVVAPAKRPRVLDGGGAAAAVRVHVVGLQVLGRPAAAVEELVPLASVAGPVEDHTAVRPIEPPDRVAWVPAVDDGTHRPDHLHRRDDGGARRATAGRGPRSARRRRRPTVRWRRRSLSRRRGSAVSCAGSSGFSRVSLLRVDPRGRRLRHLFRKDRGPHVAGVRIEPDDHGQHPNSTGARRLPLRCSASTDEDFVPT